MTVLTEPCADCGEPVIAAIMASSTREGDPTTKLFYLDATPTDDGRFELLDPEHYFQVTGEEVDPITGGHYAGYVPLREEGSPRNARGHLTWGSYDTTLYVGHNTTCKNRGEEYITPRDRGEKQPPTTEELIDAENLRHEQKVALLKGETDNG